MNIPKQDYIIAYGSLLSAYSRETFSNIFETGTSVSLNGWCRAWVTRAEHEKQTYVGAYPDANKHFNAYLLKTSIDEGLREREQNYRFVSVSPENINFDKSTPFDLDLDNSRFWVCETLNIQHANNDFPVNQSYVNTCLTGAYENSGLNGVNTFISSTHYWPSKGICNDTVYPRYPRATPIACQDKQVFTQCLHDANINLF